MVGSDRHSGGQPLRTPSAGASTWVTVLSRGAASDAHGSTGKPEPAFQSAESEFPVQDRLYLGRAPFWTSPGC